MKERTKLEEHYNKFSEEKRLTRRHGQVEFRTTMRYLHRYLEKLELSKRKEDIKILDIGAGTGRYSIALSKEGYDVNAVELVKYNVGILKSKNSNVKAYQGSALNLKRFEKESFDITLLFGPMYHLFSEEEKKKALSEAVRVTKKGGYIFVAYLMNEYSILIHGFRDNHIQESIKNGKVSTSFHVQNDESDLYDYVRIADIDSWNDQVDVKRIQMIAATGAANYMRQTLNAMDDATFEVFMEYHFATCEREDLLGASSHTVDILMKIEEQSE
ncbi:MAG: methyltransferase domain-containing protein [Eubacteriales bacterium]